MTSANPFTEVPRNRAKWMSAATTAQVVSRTLRSCSNLKSGSAVTKEQFLLFRTICPDTRDPDTFNGAIFGLTPYLTQASNILQHADFQNYLMALRTRGWNNLSTFQGTTIQQRDVTDNMRKTGKLTRIDEENVNASLITFLQAITALATTCRRQWRPTRISLTADFGMAAGDSEPRKYVAITDGQLQDTTPGSNIRAVVECKTRRRTQHSLQVDMQEVSQMVAWVKEYPDRDQSPVVRR